MKYCNFSALQDVLVGVNLIMVTPFDKEGEVDIDKVKEHTNYLIESGLKEGAGVLTLMGSMSECFSLNPEERRSIIEAAIEEVDGRVPVIVGCNDTNTRTAIKLARDAQKAGADGVMITPPYYFPASNEEILAFYKTVLRNIDLGLVIYNNVAVSVDIPLKVLEELSKIEGVVGIKDCTNDWIKFQLTANSLRDEIALLNGGGELMEPFGTLVGAQGFYTLVGNFYPGLLLELWGACEDGDYVKAEKISARFTRFAHFERNFGKPIQATKKIMRDVGLAGGYVRSPLTPLTNQEKSRVEEIKNTMLPR